MQSRTEQLLIRLELDALNAEFAYLIDHGQSEKVPELFTEDGAYGRSTGERSVGRAAIALSYRARLAKGPRTARHVFTNLRLTYESETRVRGTCILTLYAEDGLPPLPAEPMVVADYHDVYALCADGRWRFEERVIAWLFERPGAASPLALGASGAEGA